MQEWTVQWYTLSTEATLLDYIRVYTHQEVGRRRNAWPRMLCLALTADAVPCTHNLLSDVTPHRCRALLTDDQPSHGPLKRCTVPC